MAVPSAPTLEGRSQGGGVVRLVISDVGGTSYSIYSDTTSPAALLVSAAAVAGINYDVPAGDTVWYYRVTATNASGESAFSNEVAVQVSSPPRMTRTRALKINRSAIAGG